MSQQTIPIKNKPRVEDIWKGIGGHFDSLGQIINEFLDNSISNFSRSNPLQKIIYVTLKETVAGGSVEITIEDSGTGIEHLDSAFALGSNANPDSPLNEHGFGMKHALATANPENNDWTICTRTHEDVRANRFKEIQSSYKIEDFAGTVKPANEWPGAINGSGTFVRFSVSRDMFLTLGRGIQGGPRSFLTLADILCEDIGFVYADIIKNAQAQITIIGEPIGGDRFSHTVGAVEPDIVEMIDPGEGVEQVDLGNGLVSIAYKFAHIRPKQVRETFNNSTTRKYYKCNMSSSGVEIRINGRVLSHNLFQEIWGIEKHNTFNSLLVIINLKSDNANALPKTRTSKNGLREGDERLTKLYEWILSHMNPPERDSSMAQHETELFTMLATQFKNTFADSDPNAIVKTEYEVFTHTGDNADKVRADMYTYTNGIRTVYEGKRESTSCKDVYQLRMYWDGLVYDQTPPSKAILVAKYHPDSVKQLIELVNGMFDANGNSYNIEAKTWADYNL